MKLFPLPRFGKPLNLLICVNLRGFIRAITGLGGGACWQGVAILRDNFNGPHPPKRCAARRQAKKKRHEISRLVKNTLWGLIAASGYCVLVAALGQSL